MSAGSDAPISGTEGARLYSTIMAEKRAAVRARLDGENAAEGWACVEADKHQPVSGEAYCSCGFCVWSTEHVVVMVLRSMFEHRVIAPDRAASQPERSTSSVSHPSPLSTSAPTTSDDAE